jgi:hypothetical protein
VVRAVTRTRVPWLKNALIESFIGSFHPDLSEAEQPDALKFELQRPSPAPARRRGLRS